MRRTRLLLAYLKAKFKKPIRITDTTKMHVRVWVSDVDVSISNHAAILTIMETGRTDFMVRSGFFKMAMAKKWYFPSQAISVQYYRPMKAFQKATLHSRISFFDEKWIYMEQKITHKGKLMAACLVKGLIKHGKETIAPIAIQEALGLELQMVDKFDLIAHHEKEVEAMDNRMEADWEND